MTSRHRFECATKDVCVCAHLTTAATPSNRPATCGVQVRFQSQTWAMRKQLGYTSTAAAYRRIAADEGVFGGLYRVRV